MKRVLVAIAASCWFCSLAHADTPGVTEALEQHGLPAVSVDGKRVAVLHYEQIPESTESSAIELRVIDVSRDRVVERIRSTPDDKRAIEKINARLARGAWKPMVGGEQREHCPHGAERDSDARYCELTVAGLAIHYDDTRLRIDRDKRDVLDRRFPAWGHADARGRGAEPSGLHDVFVSPDGKVVLAVVTYHHIGDEERGSPDEEHVVRLR